MAIYGKVCTQSDRLNEQGEPENIRAFFDIDPELQQPKTRLEDNKVQDFIHPHLKRIK